jgi:hypothetical protein
LSHVETCLWCNGTGRVTIYDPWERAHHVIERAYAIVERGIADHVVSLDVEGSYPTAVEVERGQTDVDAIEHMLKFWPLRGPEGIYTNPLNDDGGNFAAVDPRFYA